MRGRAIRTTEKDEIFFTEFGRIANVTTACALAGYSRTSVYEWRKADSEFAQRWANAEQTATEHLEAALYERAVFGVTRFEPMLYKGKVVVTKEITEYSDTAAIFLLKARKPEMYRETLKIEVDWASEVKELGIDPQQYLAQVVEQVRKQLEADANVIDVTNSMNDESNDNAARTLEKVRAID